MAEIKRILFSCDVHGSDQVWRKWLAIPEVYKAEVIILSGDLTGKMIVPIIKQPDGRYTCSVFGQKLVAKNETEVPKIKEKIRFSGYYPYVTTPEEVAELQEDPKKVDALFEQEMIKGIERWVKLLEEKVPRDVQAIVMPGNDDIFEIDPPIEQSEAAVYPLGKAINLCFDYEMISMDYVNPTPWDSPRECSEEELMEKLEKQLELTTVDPNKLICNFHSPPYLTALDAAPKLDKDMKPVIKMGALEMVNVGSKAVLNFFKKYNPFLGLHGHIHESSGYEKIGDTFSVNPGSEYGEGILKGFIFEISKDKLEKWWFISG